MSFEKEKDERFKEIRFLFSFRIATKSVFEYFINELNQPSSSSLYLSEIYDYVKNNYLKGFRDYAENELKDVPDLLMCLDEKYLNRLSSTDLLSQIKEYFYKKEYNETTGLNIKYNIELFINEKKKDVENDNYELLFYLYMFSVLQTEVDCFYTESATQLLNLNLNEGVSCFRDLLKDLKLKEINKNIILDKLKENDTNNKYISYIQIFECVLKPIKEGEYFQFNTIKELFNNPVFTPKENKTMVEIILNV